MVQYNSSMMQMMYCWGASRVCIIIRSENKRPMGPIAHLINNSHFSPDILILNTELLLKQVDFIVISHIEHCSSQEDLKTVVHKLTVIYIFSYVKTGPPPPYPPMWSHPTIEDHNFEKLESTQSENTFTKITAFLADYCYAHHCIASI